MCPKPERVTVDTDVLWAYAQNEPKRAVVEQLLELAREGVIELAAGASGHNYDFDKDPNGDTAKAGRKLIADEGIATGVQLSYPGRRTYPGKTLVPGAHVPGFVADCVVLHEIWQGGYFRVPDLKERVDGTPCCSLC